MPYAVCEGNMIPETKKIVYVKAPRKGVVDIKILGHRDPRGPDNNVYVWVDETDQLHIRILKAQRCYTFKEVLMGQDWLEIVAD
jgi:hypothetical protein